MPSVSNRFEGPSLRVGSLKGQRAVRSKHENARVQVH